MPHKNHLLCSIRHIGIVVAIYIDNTSHINVFGVYFLGYAFCNIFRINRLSITFILAIIS